MDFIRLCSDYRIELVGAEHHHVSAGWVGVHCPFCSGKNFHLGYNLSSGVFHCWRCGTHPRKDALERLTGTSLGVLYERYGGGSSRPAPRRRKRITPVISKLRSIALPKGFTEPLRPHHAAYLTRRGFDPTFLAEEWGIESTRPTASISGSKYGNRIFIPIRWEGRTVSFQARTCSTIVKPKYKHCPENLETYPIRQIIYRHPEASYPYGICVEGPADVWRIGRHAFGTLGIGYSKTQVACIARHYRRVMVVFDPEPVAQKRAEKIARELKDIGVEAWAFRLKTNRDPGDLYPEEARELVQELLA